MSRHMARNKSSLAVQYRKYAPVINGSQKGIRSVSYQGDDMIEHRQGQDFGARFSAEAGEGTKYRAEPFVTPLSS